jgi:hypothetical protein
MIYKLQKNSTYGRKGGFVDLDGNEARQLAFHGVISMDEPVVLEKVSGPEITKVTEPEVKKRGRPRKQNASDTND